MTIEKELLKNEIIRIASKAVPDKHYKLFFFGSRVIGSATERSDFDIGIMAEKELSPKIIRQIKEELDKLRVLQKFDVVDFNQVSEDFKKVALQNMEIIYER